MGLAHKLTKFFHFEVGHIKGYTWGGWPRDVSHVWQGYIMEEIAVGLFQVILQFLLVSKKDKNYQLFSHTLHTSWCRLKLIWFQL